MLRKLILKISSRFYNKYYRKKNNKKSVTFISQNCIGGVLYHMLGLEFASPTVNMFIEDENFVKLVENPKYYFSIDAEPFEECHIDGELRYPVIKVDDIVLCCQHYENCAQAVDAWNKRRIRVNYDEIYVICCSWNLHEKKELVERINNSKYPSVIFTMEDFNFSNCIRISKEKWFKDKRGDVKPALTSFDGLFGKRYFVDLFDFVKWINH